MQLEDGLHFPANQKSSSLFHLTQRYQENTVFPVDLFRKHGIYLIRACIVLSSAKIDMRWITMTNKP